jgi:type I phosphodiesterase/nucleotide pyrophosphatase
MSRWYTRALMLAWAGGLVASTLAAAGPVTASARESSAKHVLLLSVDGLHQTDLAWYVRTHSSSALAMLVRRGVEFSNAHTPFPSDSFPGMTAPMTGGNPRSTGIYYDDSWNRALFPAAANSNNDLTTCAGLTPGAEVTYFEAAAKDPKRLDSGQGLAGLPDTILQLTADATSLIDPAQLPRDANCNPVYPHSYIKVNTIMEVATAAGLGTAWSDKHAAYELFNGNSGSGVKDYFTPEINSNAPLTTSMTGDWTTDNALTMRYDSYKVQAVINWINGWDHSGTTRVATPAIFGMNFQTISTAEKLPTSNGLTGGYLADGQTPGGLLKRELDYINAQVGSMVDALKARHLDRNTVIILTAKHGQSPQTPSALTRIADSKVISDLNAAWVSAGHTGDLVAFSINDDGMLMWLNDRSGAGFAKNFLLSYAGSGTGTDGKAKSTDINGNAKPYTAAGLATVYAGEQAADFMNVSVSDARVPDLIGISQYGTVYTGKKAKIAEHGGNNPQDRDVPILVAGGPVEGGEVVNTLVETTQIAPTILELLGLDPHQLKAVQIEHTKALPLGDSTNDNGHNQNN